MQWLCRYISVYLWLPVADLFSSILAKIQVLILQNDIERLATDPTFAIDATNGAYIIFMIIGIVGYFTVPSVSNWVIQSSIGNYTRNVNAVIMKAGDSVMGTGRYISGKLFS
jgi:conjugative transposon TraJ protein